MQQWPLTVLTLYPQMFPGPLEVGVIGRALKEKIWQLNTINIRDFAADKHATVDDTPYGGGAGMVMRADVVGNALEHGLSLHSNAPRTLYMSPRGKPLNHAMVKELAAHEGGLLLLCGRFEGVDQRVIDHYNMEEVSLGDFVLSGGELAAMALMDACLRYRPDVLGSQASLEEESFTHHLLEYPHYTRPKFWAGKMVPDVLMSGDHKKIDDWRKQQAEELTKARRSDLWDKYCKLEGLK